MPEMQSVNNQPQGTAPMQAGGNRNVLDRPVGPDGKRDWSFGLCSCSDRWELCCWSFFCPCVVYSKNKQRLRHLQTQGTPLPGPGKIFDDQCFIYGALEVLARVGFILQIGNRANVRERYNIRGSFWSDCFVSCCCRSLNLTQERREIEMEEGSF